MAEVLAVVGSIGAIANIIDATSKVISVISDIQAQWKDADLTILSLASQLSAFRAALRRIQEWVDNERPVPHHQLIMDLDETLSFCNILVARVEALFKDWDSLVDQPASTASRWKVTFGNKGLDNILVLVERQTSALTLLLTACNCKTMAEQSRLLEKPKTRRVLQRVKVDSASLFVHRDSASFRSKMTDNLSKMSLVFDFDPEVFSSGVYHRVFRGSLKYRLRQQQSRLDRPNQLPWDLIPGTQAKELETAKNVTAWNLSDDVLAIIYRCQMNMLQDCVEFTVRLQDHISDYEKRYWTTPEPVPNPLITIRDTTHQAITLWRDPHVEALYSGPLPACAIQPWSSTTSLPRQYHPMSLCRFFGHQLKALRDGRFQSQITNCIGDLARAYETASMHSASILNAAGYTVITVWSRRTQQNTSDTLTIVIQFPLVEKDYGACSRDRVVEDVALALDPLIYDVKYRTPANISFVLLLGAPFSWITTLADACFPLADHLHNHYIDVVLAETVRLFRESNEYTPCNYLTIWNNAQAVTHILAPIHAISRKGQVRTENGIYRAKLLPMNS